MWHRCIFYDNIECNLCVYDYTIANYETGHPMCVCNKQDFLLILRGLWQCHFTSQSGISYTRWLDLL